MKIGSPATRGVSRRRSAGISGEAFLTRNRSQSRSHGTFATDSDGSRFTSSPTSTRSCGRCFGAMVQDFSVSAKSTWPMAADLK